MSNVFSRPCTLLVVFGGLAIGACGSPSVPSAIPSVKPAQGAELGQSAGDVSSGLKASALSQGLTDVTLANAGWTCIQPGNGLTLCAPPGTGIPPIPPAADGQPTYDLMAFTTLDHQFVHHIKLLRPDLYHGQPCLGGDPWTYLAFLNYYECIIPAQG
jgi:hypothetical protein